jgi:hypothetical protein
MITDVLPFFMSGNHLGRYSDLDAKCPRPKLPPEDTYEHLLLQSFDITFTKMTTGQQTISRNC